MRTSMNGKTAKLFPAPPWDCRKRQKGITTVEYAVAGALVAAALLAAFDALGIQIGQLIDFLSNAMDI